MPSHQNSSNNNSAINQEDCPGYIYHITASKEVSPPPADHGHVVKADQTPAMEDCQLGLQHTGAD